MDYPFVPVSWSHTTNIYEVNLRQYTAEGTIKAFAMHLPRLRAMGVETLWFMPMTPIAAERRQGSLGSYYACSSYVQTNPEFGTTDDFCELVKQAHDLGMKVIIDWVANHTGYGHEWLTDHKDYFVLDEHGHTTERNGWEDVIDLDYQNPAMRLAMIEAMAYWVKECDIDGFRCDMAHLVPLDFWLEARMALDAIKPLFWLAECEVPVYHLVFDVSYAWEWMHKTEDFIRNKHTITVLDKVLYRYEDEYPGLAMKMYFTSNHDENSWNGTEFEKYGDAAIPLAVFSATWNGIPLIYSGQEIPNTRRLQFFERDPIDWSGELRYEDLYRRLLTLRKNNPALAAGDVTVLTNRLNLSGERVFGFLRKHGAREVLVLLNFSEDAIQLNLNDHRVHGVYYDVLRGGAMDFDEHRALILHGYGYKVLER